MIKLDRVILEVKDEVENKLENMSEVYKEALRESELTGGIEPQRPTYKMKREDYEETIVDYRVRAGDVVDVSEDQDGDTIITVVGRTSEVIVKQSVDEVDKLIEDEEERLRKNKKK